MKAIVNPDRELYHNPRETLPSGGQIYCQSALQNAKHSPSCPASGKRIDARFFNGGRTSSIPNTSVF